jgi:hypothetical protein
MDKKGIIALLIVVIVLVVGYSMRGHLMAMFSRGKSGSVDLTVINDTSETASVAFTRDGKMASRVMHAGEKVTGGRGLIRVFVAQKNGAYELMYPYPRPAGRTVEVAVSTILNAVHNPHLGKELLVSQGMIDDIKVEYEEVRDLDATY